MSGLLHHLVDQSRPRGLAGQRSVLKPALGPAALLPALSAAVARPPGLAPAPVQGESDETRDQPTAEVTAPPRLAPSPPTPSPAAARGDRRPDTRDSAVAQPLFEPPAAAPRAREEPVAPSVWTRARTGEEPSPLARPPSAAAPLNTLNVVDLPGRRERPAPVARPTPSAPTPAVPPTPSVADTKAWRPVAPPPPPARPSPAPGVTPPARPSARLEPRPPAVRPVPAVPRPPAMPPRPVTVRIGRLEVVSPAPPPLAVPEPALPRAASGPDLGEDLLARLWLDRCGYDR